ncbi:hypothetical protein [Fibrella forsythiae]|uniref:PA14 domain-containing protein n=1 Tax=Fibrella forsythiae TaxID=2817061 RepID=A0ABS3JHM1_9BACT|nr:hypothetical protein [Fibrella forsythiae]MBO0949496.1 hypothetical protein [Fibrella forsythiae]
MCKLTLLLGSICIGLSGLGTLSYAQTTLPRLDLATLSPPATWQRAGGLLASPDGPTLKAKAGQESLLISTGKEALTLATPASDFSLQFDVLMSAGANASLVLPNGESLSLDHSLDITPLLRAPGLWQTIRLDYRAESSLMTPTIERLIVNGVVVREGYKLTRKAAGAKPVQVQAQTGSLAVRNVGYRALENRSVANWAGPVNYKLYGESIETREELNSKTPVKSDTVSKISYNVSYGRSGRFAMLYNGKLNVPTAGDYQFDLVMGGIAGLWVDGKPVIPVVYDELGAVKTHSMPLTAGTHAVEVMYARSWPRPGLGLFISQAGTRPQALHADGSLPEFSPPGQVTVQPDTKPTLIRSFIQLPGERNKRTKSLSVGSASGVHYAVDLGQMALLMAWKGDFADVTQMWYERGEPQLLKPMGTVIMPSPKPAFAMLPSANAAWPDSLNEDVLTYGGLVLAKDGSPTLEYIMNGLTIRESLRPAANRLDHVFAVTGNVPAQPVYCRLAAGKTIDEVAKGLYAIDDRSYYIRVDPKAGLTVRQQGGQQELVMPVSLKDGAGTVQYAIEF